MEVKHVCLDCGDVIAVHEHSSWQQIKECQAGMKALCPACASWPGCPLPPERMRGQEVTR